MKHKTYEDYKKKIEEFETSGEWPEDLGNSDHADSVECTLIEVDMKLKVHGLEIVQYNTKNDTVVWYIAKRVDICTTCGYDKAGIGGWGENCPNCSEGPYW